MDAEVQALGAALDPTCANLRRHAVVPGHPALGQDGYARALARRSQAGARRDRSLGPKVPKHPSSKNLPAWLDDVRAKLVSCEHAQGYRDVVLTFASRGFDEAPPGRRLELSNNRHGSPRLLKRTRHVLRRHGRTASTLGLARRCRTGSSACLDGATALQAWQEVARALAQSSAPDDRSLVAHVLRYVRQAFGPDGRRQDQQPVARHARAGSRIEQGPGRRVKRSRRRSWPTSTQ